ncbi:hypothetical protein JXO52_11000 [bacterium]|nr:hypothetical protein [bacterium]
MGLFLPNVDKISRKGNYKRLVYLLAHIHVGDDAYAAIIKAGEPALACLIKGIQDDNARIRARSLGAIIELDLLPRVDSEILYPVLNDRRLPFLARVRVAACLARLGHAGAVGRLGGFMNNPDLGEKRYQYERALQKSQEIEETLTHQYNMISRQRGVMGDLDREGNLAELDNKYPLQRLRLMEMKEHLAKDEKFIAFLEMEQSAARAIVTAALAEIGKK